jgi:hypothetical protein
MIPGSGNFIVDLFEEEMNAPKTKKQEPRYYSCEDCSEMTPENELDRNGGVCDCCAGGEK